MKKYYLELPNLTYNKSTLIDIKNKNLSKVKNWEIEIDTGKLKSASEEEIEEYLDEFFEEYDEVIESVDFRLNTAKVIKDIQARTKHFLKKRK